MHTVSWQSVLPVYVSEPLTRLCRVAVCLCMPVVAVACILTTMSATLLLYHMPASCGNSNCCVCMHACFLLRTLEYTCASLWSCMLCSSCMRPVPCAVLCSSLEVAITFHQVRECTGCVASVCQRGSGWCGVAGVPDPGCYCISRVVHPSYLYPGNQPGFSSSSSNVSQKCQTPASNAVASLLQQSHLIVDRVHLPQVASLADFFAAVHQITSQFGLLCSLLHQPTSN